MRLLVTALLATFSSLLAAQDGWRLEHGNAAWTPRTYHTTVEFNGRLWLINGWAGDRGCAERDEDTEEVGLPVSGIAGDVR
jgi:hypothetical protein